MSDFSHCNLDTDLSHPERATLIVVAGYLKGLIKRPGVNLEEDDEQIMKIAHNYLVRKSMVQPRLLEVDPPYVVDAIYMTEGASDE